MLLSIEVDFKTVSEAIINSEKWYSVFLEIHVRMSLKVGRLISK